MAHKQTVIMFQVMFLKPSLLITERYWQLFKSRNKSNNQNQLSLNIIKHISCFHFYPCTFKRQKQLMQPWFQTDHEHLDLPWVLGCGQAQGPTWGSTRPLAGRVTGSVLLPWCVKNNHGHSGRWWWLMAVIGEYWWCQILEKPGESDGVGWPGMMAMLDGWWRVTAWCWWWRVVEVKTGGWKKWEP